MKKTIITIGGTLGSGKSSTGNALAEILGYKRYSMGDIQRSYSEELNISLADYSEIQKNDLSFDIKVDKYQKEIAQKEDNFILDSRLGWFFIPESFKVFLFVPEHISAERIFQDSKKNPSRNIENIQNIEDALDKVKNRIISERERYKKLYNIDNHFDKNHFDLVIDTSKHDLTQVVAIIKETYEKWISKTE